ncbi:hypothetical protein HEK616_37910 [Streptomyces nigrescens]|uniref:Uncharacterized protein n=1 Tax=Streptomyces nigrescens TaxID=1920 RepID=A0ABM7ZVA4_STRNI|nr:hypothetical protein [Streptomyces nigrescens]BDM70304.1 hypothetical protein HEK616_37910 [Streptomyces nigrescens]
MITNEPPHLPSPDVLWSHAATLAAWSSEQQLPVHNYRLDETGLRSADVGNGWWALSWVEGGRAVLYGIDHDYSDTVGLAPPVDLLADGPSWLPWQWLDDVITGGEEIGFVYWWDGREWARAPHPVEVHDDGVHSMVPADDSEVRQVCDALVTDGADPAAVREREAAHRRTAAAPVPNGAAVLPAGQGEPTDRRVPCWLPEQHAAVLAVEMRAATELNRPAPPATPERDRLIAWLRANGPRTEGSSALSATFVDAEDTDYGRGADGFLDVLGRRIFGEAATLLAALRNAEADPERGRWLYIRITVTNSDTDSDIDTGTGTNTTSTIERGYDCLPDWWPARRGIVATLPHTVRLEMARRAAHWRPNWASLLDEDIRRDGTPARLCRVELAPPHISAANAHADAHMNAAADAEPGS